MINKNIILSGVVGSVAYGLDTSESDLDRLGVFVHPTDYFFGINQPEDTITTTKPDITLHEAAKFVRLALNANPTVTELLWLDQYEQYTEYGRMLVDIRSYFLSDIRVRNAYFGYATQQFKRLEGRGDGSFSSDTRKRTAKHARHLARLLHQGFQLYTTGELTVKLDNPKFYLDFGESVADGNLNVAKKLLHDTEIKFTYAKSVLPTNPDEVKVEIWLRKIRRYFYL